jgi:hypothetical protein
MLEAGNEAAHGGNGIADPAVIVMMQRKRHDIYEYKALFLDLYRFDIPEKYQVLPAKLQQTLNHYASIHAGKGIHGGLGTE